MTTKKPLILCSICCVIAIMLCVAGISVSQTTGTGMGERNDRARSVASARWWHNDTFAASMNLTDTQKEALEKYSLKQRLTMIDLQASLQKERLVLENFLDLNFSKDASLKYLNDYLKAKNDLEGARMKGLFHTREVLTKEQFKILKNKIRKNRMRQGDKREERMER